MTTTTKTTFGTLGLITLFVLFSCGDNKTESPAVNTQVKSVTSTPAKETTQKIEAELPSGPEDGPAIATIAAPDYEVKVYKGIAFIPEDDGGGMMKPKPGHQYLVLDMSVRNISKNKEVDMGQILLSTKVTDERGKEYRLNPMAIAAYTLKNPGPQHQAQYNAIWGTLKPGDFYRTTAYGMEVQEGTKTFVLSMKEDGDTFKDSKRYKAKFSIE